MPNSNKTTGTLFETAVLKVLQAAGLRAVKPRQTTALDTGDIHVGEDVLVQAKDWANLSGALDAGTKGAQVQARRAGRPFGVAVVKRRGRHAREAYVVMPLHVFTALLNSRDK